MQAESKKRFIELEQVRGFIADQADAVRAEYLLIVARLETRGTLEMPLAEKISGKNLFVIRVIHAGNIRVFYVYGHGDIIWGIHAYEKKTRTIPAKEMSKAERAVKILRQRRLIK
jgi:phage-related protein